MAGFIYPVSKINAKQITKTLIFVQFCGRPPHRGAWIEIGGASPDSMCGRVAPRTGGRGLKYMQKISGKIALGSPPAQGGVD